MMFRPLIGILITALLLTQQPMIGEAKGEAVRGNSECVRFYKETIPQLDIEITLGSKVRYCHTLGGT